MNYKRKSNLAIVLMVALAALLTGCVAAFQTDSSENSDISCDMNPLFDKPRQHKDDLAFRLSKLESPLAKDINGTKASSA
jgi:hypothetical protein